MQMLDWAAMRRMVRLLCLATSASGWRSSFALEFTADQITKIDGRTDKANIYYRDKCGASSTTRWGRSTSALCERTSRSCGCCCHG